ncbi:MAG: endonuclease MutS2 [Clostridia bacterium]
MNSILIKKVCHTLEQDKICSLLAEYAVSDIAKTTAINLLPTSDIEEIRLKLAQTNEALSLIYKKGAPPFSSAKNVSAIISRTKISATLNFSELLQIASVLKTARQISEYFEQESEKAEYLSGYFNNINGNKFLEELITNSIISDEEMSDGASDTLYGIRRKIKITSNKVRDLLFKLIHSQTTQKYLQEPIITTRQDRFVIPVKAEYKNEIKGIVHDSSASGATLFIEPMSVVNANNDLRELYVKEKYEIEQILFALSCKVSEFSDNILLEYESITALDFIFAKAKLAKAQDAICPIINDTKKIKLKKARHPLIERKKVVPINISLGEEYQTLLITGPNTGGKTVTLKTVGLLTVMMQCGLLVTADFDSEMAVFENVFADIGDEQSIEQSLSTFSSHLKNIITITENVESNSLVLLDELGAGTDPVEGASLAISILEYIRGFGALSIATTHYFELKTYAVETVGVENASCEFDVETLMPTYKLIIGTFGKSNAFKIAYKLGLSDQIIAAADSLLNKEHKNIDEVLSNLEQSRLEIEKQKSEIKEQKELTIQLNEELKKKSENNKKELETLVFQKTEDLDNEIEKAKTQTEKLISELEELKSQKDSESFNENLSKLRSITKKSIYELQEKNKVAEESGNTENITVQLGDIVTIKSINKQATVVSMPDKSGNLTVVAGLMKTKLNLSDIRQSDKSEKRNLKRANKVTTTLNKEKRAGSLELDLRGMMQLDAQMELERFIDNALVVGTNGFTVIHGKGTGALRKMVHQTLKNNKNVRTFRLGVFGEGEMGVTIVELK